MRVFHDTRDSAFRTPYGAVSVGEPVTLTLEVRDAPGASAILRTWRDGEGERRLPMEPVASDAGDAGGQPAFYQIAVAFDTAGIVWYHFIITDAEGREWRYGACNGQLGGSGQLIGWEPPSFRLSVYEEAQALPAWYEPIGSYLFDGDAPRDLPDVVATLCENYPVGACRTAAPWDLGDYSEPAPESLPDMATAFEALGAGGCSWFSAGDNVFGIWREGEGGSVLCVLVNASTVEGAWVCAPMVRDEVSELVVGYGVDVIGAADAGDAGALFPEAGRFARVRLDPVASLVLHFHAAMRLAPPMDPGLGVLAHITSLPMDVEGRKGSLGLPARRFVDWLAGAGVRYWQVLPVNPSDEFGSPYAGISAFAGNALLLEGGFPVDRAVLEQVADSPDYADFRHHEADWLEPYACFMAIRRKVGDGKMWQEWPKEYRSYAPALLERDAKLAAYAEEFRRTQFAFERQWRDLRAYANERGVSIVGDMPIYVSADSADVWAHPELFQLGPDGKPEVVAGCAPDAFAVDGQVWGNPVYNWDAMRESGYAWWFRRLEHAFSVYDFVRLDHFIGFSRYFSIPAGEKAAGGTYHRGPGFELFRLAREKFGPLPIIAEDLGLITPRVRSLVASCGFPGMDIIQFADGGDPLSRYTPRPEKVVYTGTHDNQTLLGYVRARYPHEREDEAFDSLVERVVGCGAPVRILPLQDVLRLGDEARMNVPGVAEGNWAWQADAADIAAALDYAKELSGA